MERPDTRITRNGELPLAYQVFGEGPTDLVYLPGFVYNVEGNWDVPGIASFMRGLASFTRVVVMDRRNTGCSERLSPGQAATLEEMVDDLDVVMRGASCRRTTLFAVQESAFIAMMAAATHPHRFERLILFGAAPCWRRNDEISWAWSDEEWEDAFAAYRFWTSIQDYYEGYVRTAAPSLIGDPVTTRLLAALGMLTNGPLASEAESRRFSDIDVRPLLPVITVPTLVLHRTDDPVEPIESGRFLAERIPNATLVELPGEDGLPWIGEAGPVLAEIERVVTGKAPNERSEAERVLATVLFTDIVGSTARASEIGDARWRSLVERHHRAVRDGLADFRGTEVDTAGDGFFAVFDGPARAVQCALSVAHAVRDLGIEIRAGVHTGEVETIDGKVGGIAVNIGARVMSEAGPSEVLVSQTVKDLVAGSGLLFEDAGDHDLKGIPESRRLYRAGS
jgi:class 3 adenylate cyclase/pimeloyl-ACP methyl ester carboxylesterase